MESTVQQQVQTYHQLMGLIGTNPFSRHNSAARTQMYYGHISQSLPTKGVNARSVWTGVEDEFAKYTHSVMMPCNAEIYRTIQKDPTYGDSGKNLPNPMTLIIYQNMDNEKREFDVLEMPKTHCLHQHYGFSYKVSPHARSVTQNALIAKGTILADSPTVREDGTHMYGTETNYATMTLPEVTEDGSLVSEEWLDTQEVECFGSRTFRFGGDKMPLNVNGNLDEYKIIPDIGERISPTGLLFATRKFDPMLAPIYMHPESLRNPETGDDMTFAIPNAIITDVTIMRGRNENSAYPSEFNAQCHYYLERARKYYRSILDVEKELRGMYNNNLRFAPALEALFTEAHAQMDQANRRCEVDPYFDKLIVRDWLIKVDFKYKLRPTIGNKLSDEQGSKSIIVAKRFRRDMPTDYTGEVADVVMDPKAPVNRNNTGRNIEQSINASSKMVQKTLARMLAADSSEAGLQSAWEYVYGYCAIVSPPMAALMADPRFDAVEFIYESAKHMRLYLPPDNPVNYFDVVAALNTTYPPPYGPVTYRGNSGLMRTTKLPILIGSIYTFILEKDGRSWSGVASSRLHGSFGVPTKPGPGDKWSLPGKESPIKAWGETEQRLANAACGGEAMAELIERSNNPAAHKSVCQAIISSGTPTNIPSAVDWTKIPKTGGRIAEYTNHVFMCAGIKLVHTNHEEA